MLWERPGPGRLFHKSQRTCQTQSTCKMGEDVPGGGRVKGALRAKARGVNDAACSENNSSVTHPGRGGRGRWQELMRARQRGRPAFPLAPRRTPAQLCQSALLSAPLVCATFPAVTEPMAS